MFIFHLYIKTLKNREEVNTYSSLKQVELQKTTVASLQLISLRSPLKFSSKEPSVKIEKEGKLKKKKKGVIFKHYH